MLSLFEKEVNSVLFGISQEVKTLADSESFPECGPLSKIENIGLNFHKK